MEFNFHKLLIHSIVELHDIFLRLYLFVYMTYNNVLFSLVFLFKNKFSLET